MSIDLTAIKEKLLNAEYESSKINKALAYLSTEQAKKDNNVVKHNDLELYNMIVKYFNAGTNLDGINVIVAGKNMGLITYHGYMNKVKQNHKDVFFDVQLVRDGDTFSFAKESGSVVYTHNISNPFEATPKDIIGAYCVVKFEGGNESLELLNSEDYTKMKDSSRNKGTWEKWESEFWRKSVIKRACKIYFAEEVAELEKIDNEDYGLAEKVKASDELKKAIIEQNSK